MGGIKLETVTNCFIHAGFPQSLFNPPSQGSALINEEFQELVQTVSVTLTLLDPGFVWFDSDIMATVELSDTWELDLLRSVQE